MLEIDENDILVGSPRSKFFDMLYSANKNLVEEVLEGKIEEHAAMEILLNEIFGDDYLLKIKQKIYEEKSLVDSVKCDFFMDVVNDILTKHE